MKPKALPLFAVAIIFALTVLSHANDVPSSIVVDGEHFTLRQITDSNLNNVVAYRFSAPKNWRDSGRIYWDFMNIKTPMTMSASVENPTNAGRASSFRR